MSAIIPRLAGALVDTKARLRAVFALPEPGLPDHPFAPSDVAQLHRVTAQPGQASLDEQTWSDLLLGRYLDEVSRETSIFGRQELYRRLRAGPGGDARAAQRERVSALADDPDKLSALRASLGSLRHADAEVATLLFEDELPLAPRWAGRTWPLPLGLAASVAAVAVSPFAWLGVALALYLLIAIQVKYYERVQAWNRRVNSLQMLLRTQSLLAEEEGLAARGFDRSAGDRAGRINRMLSRSPTARVVPGAAEYGDWFFLSNVNHYFKGVQIVRTERAFLRECLLRCACLEADAALARHLSCTERWCWAGQASTAVLEIEAGVHPLLADAAGLSITLSGRGAFISGQNGVGKSTFLRMLGLNLVTARGFGFCYAGRAQLPMLPVYASMQNEDSLLGGESLYMAELRRARELLDSAAEPGIYLIDEIFRGTNHLESVAAAAAVLDSLAERGLVVVSSHNLELASLLAHRFDPHCIVRADDGGGLRLRAGVLAQTNGIALLAARGFAPQLQHKAERVARWLERYLAEPDAGRAVLAEGSGA